MSIYSAQLLYKILRVLQSTVIIIPRLYWLSNHEKELKHSRTFFITVTHSLHLGLRVASVDEDDDGRIRTANHGMHSIMKPPLDYDTYCVVRDDGRVVFYSPTALTNV